MAWKNVSRIEPQLFIGNLRAARSSRSLTERHITHIISVCNEAIPAELPESGIKHMRIDVEDVDYADLLIWFPAACRFISRAIEEGGIVLVHCVQGLSRSAAIVAAYLMWSRGIHAAEALDAIRREREWIWPNPGFQEQLVLFELCGYRPHPDEGVYRNWRASIDRRIREGQVPQLLDI